MTLFNLLLPINFLNPHTDLHDDFLSDSDKGRDNWNGSNARMATRDGDLWRLRHRARQSRGGDRADDGQNAPVTSWFFCHLVLRRLWVSPFLSLDLLLADVDRRGGLPSPSASTTQTPLPADQWPSGCECGVRTKCGGMAKSVAFHGTTQKVAHCPLPIDMKCEAQKVGMAKSTGLLTKTQIVIVPSPNCHLPLICSFTPELVLPRWDQTGWGMTHDPLSGMAGGTSYVPTRSDGFSCIALLHFVMTICYRPRLHWHLYCRFCTWMFSGGQSISKWSFSGVPCVRHSPR